MADADIKHDYHLVDPSPWPIIGSVGAFVLALGAVGFMNANGLPVPFTGLTVDGPWMMLIGFGVVVFTMIGWWIDVVREGEHRGDHTPVVQIGLRYGMVLFIASEVMFFVAWFWAYFNTFLFHEAHGIAGWPPEGVETFDPWHLPLMNTLILLTSGTTVTWSHHALQQGDRKSAIQGLWLTILLGASFTCVQVYEYAHAGFAFSGNIYGSTFFMATGFHGFHVLVGTIFLTICLIRLYAGHFTSKQHFGFEAAAWYWHFVDVVWLFLFACIYVWGQGTPGAGH